MNIIFHKIRWKNLLSTGNIFTELLLDTHKTTLISGKNGNGKSTAIEALVFVLYGKPFRKVNKSQLINTINQKELVVEVEFTIGPHRYMVRRGMKPNIFEIYCDGILKDKSTTQQDDFEKNILKINMKTFTQIVILGSATYVPFMKLEAKDRRDIVEDLLDIQIFSNMNILLKEKISLNKEEIATNNSSIELLQTKIDSALSHNAKIQKIREDHLDKIKKRMNEYISTIETNTANIELLENNIKQALATIDDKHIVTTRREEMCKINNELSVKTSNIDKDLKFYSTHDNCPTCRQQIDELFKQSIISSNSNKKQQLQDVSDTLSGKMQLIDVRLDEIKKIEQQIQYYQTQASDCRIAVKIAKASLSSCKKEMDEYHVQTETSDVEMNVDSMHQQMNILQEKQQQAYVEREIMAAASTMLKDGGIKTKVIRQYTPIMNKIINQYLAEFELFVDFQLTEQFEEIIKSRFRDTFSYASFSEGEKLRINLAIMLTWRAISKMRNSISTNLLWMDETLDGAMDSTGVENLIDTLNTLNADDNIFVISHRGEIFGDKFDSHIHFEKEKNFSVCSIVSA